jgi:hypothetical protein
MLALRSSKYSAGSIKGDVKRKYFTSSAGRFSFSWHPAPAGSSDTVCWRVVRVTTHSGITSRSFGLALCADKQLGGMMANHGRRRPDDLGYRPDQEMLRALPDAQRRQAELSATKFGSISVMAVILVHPTAYDDVTHLLKVS